MSCIFCSRNKFATILKNDYAEIIVCSNVKNKGHSLIIPKKHSSNLASTGMDETIWKEGIVPLLFEFIKKLYNNPQVIGFWINSNGGAEAEQTVFHTHIHIVPQYQKDEKKWNNFLQEDFTALGSIKISGKWDEFYPKLKEHVDQCLKNNHLKKDNSGVIKHFNIISRIKKDSPNIEEHFEIIPKTTDSKYCWEGEKNKPLCFEERQKIAKIIQDEKWELLNSQLEDNIENDDWKNKNHLEEENHPNQDYTKLNKQKNDEKQKQRDHQQIENIILLEQKRLVEKEITKREFDDYQREINQTTNPEEISNLLQRICSELQLRKSNNITKSPKEENFSILKVAIVFFFFLSLALLVALVYQKNKTKKKPRKKISYAD